MAKKNSNNEVEHYLRLSPNRSFLLISQQGIEVSETILELKTRVLDFFKLNGSPESVTKSHVFTLEEDENKEKLRHIIKKFENNLLRKPTKGNLNIGIIDFEFVSRNKQFQQLLKLLEEPPKSTQIYVITKESIIFLIL